MAYYRFSESSVNRLRKVHPELQKILYKAIEYSPIDFGIPQFGGLRTPEEQSMLYKDGKSKLDGYENKSKHQTGLAIDIYAYVNGKASWDREHYFMLAGHLIAVARVLGYDLRWGGDWKNDRSYNDHTSFDDLPHFELIIKE